MAPSVVGATSASSLGHSSHMGSATGHHHHANPLQHQQAQPHTHGHHGHHPHHPQHLHQTGSMPTPAPRPMQQDPTLLRSPRSANPYPQSTGPRPLGEPNPNFDFDLSFLDQPVHDLSNSMHMANMSSSSGGSAEPDSREGTARAYGTLSNLVGIHKDDNSGLRGSIDDGENQFEVIPHGEISILPSVPQGRDVVGGWFDPNDVPPAVRDHLLDLFFSRCNSGGKALFGITLHLPRFYTRLTLLPQKRPHPGLLYSMFCCAARVSMQPAIRQLERQFYEIAEKRCRQAVANHDRLLDALRGMTLLANYLFASEQYAPGYHMTGAAVRLAISCGLDRIPSSVWAPPPPFNAAIHCTLRTGGYALQPPEDAIDLAERIYAFWAVYEVDCCTAVAYLWHTGLAIEDIRTPFPRPMIEYELGLVSTKDDVTMNTVIDPPLMPPAVPDHSFLVLRLKAVTLLARVHKLRQEAPEIPFESPESPGAGRTAHGCSYPGSAQPAFVTHPTGFGRMKAALDHFIDNLPDADRPPWRWDEGNQTTLPRVQLSRETCVLHFLIGNAYMQLWNIRALDAENAVALLVARRLVNVMFLYQTEPMSTGYDIFMITIWNEVAMVLVREVKRLQYLGMDDRAAEIDADLGVAINALKKWGDVDIAVKQKEGKQPPKVTGDHDILGLMGESPNPSGVTDLDGADIAAINGKMLEQLRMMSKEDWGEAMAESRRRYGGGEMPLGTTLQNIG